MIVVVKHAIEKSRAYNGYKREEINFLSIADALSDGIYVIDRNGIIIDANENYKEIAGLKEGKLIGMNMRDLWKDTIYTTEEAFIELSHNKMPTMAEINGMEEKNLKDKKPEAIGLIMLEEKKEISIITRIARKDRTVIMTGIPFFNEKGEIEWVVTVIRDVTEFVHLKEELENFENDKEVYLNELNYLRKTQMEADLVGETAGIEMIRGLILQIANADVTVLITGETGVGKEVVAREIYKNSQRRNGPYIKVNCAAIPESLLESELFGYEKGAFTGAQNKDKLGLFQSARSQHG
jgi:transcriptional regulator with PAS, ATPase and Fis domain